MTQSATVKRWIDVVGYEGLYQVSIDGQVRSLDRICSDGRLYKGKHLVARPNARGYMRVGLSRSCKTKWFAVHVLMLEAWVGKRPAHHEACHRNGIRTDNRIENLKWGTKLENAMDKRIHGTMLSGEAHGRAKISEAEAIEIRTAHASGSSIKQMHERFHISRSAVRHILKRRTWSHI